MIGAAKHRDERRRLHEERVQEALLKLRLLPRHLLTLAKKGVGFGGAPLVFDVGVRAEPVSDLTA